MRRKMIAVFISTIALIVLFVSQDTMTISQQVFTYLVEFGVSETSSDNLVTSVYLYYRYYDTIFEALLLIISVIAIIYLSIHKERYHD